MNESHSDGQSFTALLREVSEQATFHTSLMGDFPPVDFKKFYYLSSRPNAFRWAHSAEPQFAEDLKSELVRRLQLLFPQYIADDQLGNGLAYLLGGTVEPTMSEFAQDVVRAAVVLGPERAAKVLDQWGNREPVEYRLCAILTGITGDCFLTLEPEGIRFETLPSNDWDQLAAHLPFDSLRAIGDADLASHVKVIVNCRAEPALYSPADSRPQFQRTWARGPAPERVLDAICESLSLTFDAYVAWRIRWLDLGDLEVFKHSGGARASYSTRYEFTQPRHAEWFRQRGPEMRELLLMRLGRKRKEGHIDRAIKRWMRSKRSADIVDQFIELRVALESLYLPAGGEAKRFHVSYRGAWHLGKDFSERRSIQKTLLRAYDTASQAVHRSSIENEEESRRLLESAQALCRRGILKRLHEGQEPIWNELLLGGDM